MKNIHYTRQVPGPVKFNGLLYRGGAKDCVFANS